MKIFISYSWDSDEHKDWVLNLADMLVKNGIFVFLDRWDLSAGKNMTFFMENSIGQADKVIIVLTENYKTKTEKRKGGVGFEYSIIRQELFDTQQDDAKFIPILKGENAQNCTPKYLQGFIHHKMYEDFNKDNAFVQLLRLIYNEPEIVRPKVGNKPIFNKKDTSLNKADFKSVLLRIKDNIIKEKQVIDLPFGFENLDRLTGGIHSDSLILISGAPLIGKTSFLISILKNISIKNNHACLVISNETGATRIVKRLFLTQFDVSSKSPKPVAGSPIFDKLDLWISEIQDRKVFFVDGVDVNNIETIISEYIQNHQIKIVLLFDDFKYLIEGFIDNKVRLKDKDKNEIAQIPFTLKNVAKKLNVPILFECQLSRSIEVRGGAMRPQLNDLWSAGIINHTPIDLVLLIYRPYLYNIVEDEYGNSILNRMDVYVAKNRYGTISELYYSFDNENSNIKEVVDENE